MNEVTIMTGYAMAWHKAHPDYEMVKVISYKENVRKVCAVVFRKAETTLEALARIINEK